MFAYSQCMSLRDIPVLDDAQLRRAVLDHVAQGWRMLAFFGVPEQKGVGLTCVLGHDVTGRLAAWRTAPLTAFESLTPDCPQAQRFEREIFEQWKIRPEGHPWLKPVRFCPARPCAPAGGKDSDVRPGPAQTDYYSTSGSEVHEVAVGPVHAGIIEPGHFRFQCHGENVLHLEIQLGFQHRDLERLLEAAPPGKGLPLAERIAGDSVVAHATAYCTLLERFCGLAVPERGHLLRRVGLELERLANHTGDLGAIGGDTGFLPTASWNGRIRGDFLNLTAEVCGNRFGFGLVCLGGAAFDLDAALCRDLVTRLEAAWRDARGAVDVMLETPSVLARLAGTGPVSADAAQDLGLVGVAARACGLCQDARFQKPLSDVAAGALSLRVCEGGDVLARSRVRSLEIDDAAACVKADLLRLCDSAGACRKPPVSVSAKDLAKDLAEAPPDAPLALPPDCLCVAQVEGWRGEVCHVGVTDERGGWRAYKVIDPSFHNWDGLALALREQQISDFPLCNKSFNLSYCGHDL